MKAKEGVICRPHNNAQQQTLSTVNSSPHQRSSKSRSWSGRADPAAAVKLECESQALLTAGNQAAVLTRRSSGSLMELGRDTGSRMLLPGGRYT